jgi:beta-N-acetylhexosaminidase
VNGQFLPATLSHDLTTKLLKEKMGFKGVVVTDALIMGGFVKFFGDDACVRSVGAGCDMLLWPPEHYFDDMEAAIQSGRIPMSRLDDAVQRVWRLKQKLGLLNPARPKPQPMTVSEKDFVQKTAQHIAEASITLVRDRNHLLPLKSEQVHQVAIIPVSSRETGPGKKNRAQNAAEHLASVLAGRGITSTIRQGLWLESMPKVAATNDVLIYLVCEVGFQNWDGGKTQGDTWTYSMIGRDKTIVVSLDNPFHSDEFASADTYLNAYDSSDAVIAALTRGLFGEITFTGKSPVNLSMFRKFEQDPRAK